MRTFSFSRKSLYRIGISILAGLVLLVVILVLVNGSITAWLQGAGFHDMLEKETSKGMHFEAHYAPIQRVGLLGVSAESGKGEKGTKTIVGLEGHDVTGWFNPLGIFLKRWQIDDLHFTRGIVNLQKTESDPNAKPPPGQPWYLFFWPDRVYLEDIKVDTADVLWKLKDKDSGIYGTFLEITPNGRDFEYDAKGGAFRTPLTPELNVVHTHLLIRKPRLYCQEFILGDDPARPEEQIRATGDAGLQKDRDIHLKVDLKALNVSRWVPESMRSHVLGHADGHFDYESTGTGLETGKGKGHLEVTDAVLYALKAVQLYISATQSPDPGDLHLKVCRMDLHYEKGAITADHLEVESEGVFRLSGSVTMAEDKTLSGELQLGFTDPYLKWLPTAKSAIFTRAEGGYHFTTVHVSGTSKKPQQDLSERLTKELGNHPFVALKLFFNSAGSWFDFN